MTEQEILDIVERCNTGELFCNECELGDKLHADCIELRDKAFEIAKKAFAQRDAMFADLKLVCTKNNPCLVCVHFCPEREDYENCERTDWICEWEWRGEKHG